MEEIKKILISDPLSNSGLEILGKAKGLSYDIKTGLPPAELKSLISGYDAILIRSETKLKAEIIEAADRLKVIGRAGIGLDNVDLPAATKKGILVMNTPQENAIAAAEHTIALMFSISRRIPQATASMKAGKWEKKKFMGVELFEKTLGLVGVGVIGTIVADRANLRLCRKLPVMISKDPHVLPMTEAFSQRSSVGSDMLNFFKIFGCIDVGKHVIRQEVQLFT